MRNMRSISRWGNHVDTVPPPSELPVAPHRYLWDAPFDERSVGTLQQWKETVPYKPGEVVWVQTGRDEAKRAYIMSVIPERDRFGDRREVYRVRLETNAGTWSKLWRDMWPGHVQRGYRIAGLAPDVPA
jgi:hypothetical protein